MNCECCYTDYLVKCPTELTVYAKLKPSTNYTWVITDKFDNQYEGDAVTDLNGFFTIPVEDLPAGLLTQYSGSFKLEVKDAESCKPVNFKMAGEYDCINFHVKGGNHEKSNLGCDFDCIGGSANQSALIPFTDASEVTIDWSQYSSTFGNSPTVQVYHETSPGIFSIVTVDVEQSRVNDVLTQIVVDNGGVATGYVIIS